MQMRCTAFLSVWKSSFIGDIIISFVFSASGWFTLWKHVAAVLNTFQLDFRIKLMCFDLKPLEMMEKTRLIRRTGDLREWTSLIEIKIFFTQIIDDYNFDGRFVLFVKGKLHFGLRSITLIIFRKFVEVEFEKLIYKFFCSIFLNIFIFDKILQILKFCLFFLKLRKILQIFRKNKEIRFKKIFKYLSTCFNKFCLKLARPIVSSTKKIFFIVFAPLSPKMQKLNQMKPEFERNPTKVHFTVFFYYHHKKLDKQNSKFFHDTKQDCIQPIHSMFTSREEKKT